MIETESKIELEQLPTPQKTVVDSAKLMRLLTLVDEFERDILTIRKEFGTIKNPGADWTYRVESIYKWFAKRERPIFSYMSHEPSLEFDKSDLYYQAIMAIGKKFNLPTDFYHNACFGISGLILTNAIMVVSRNWDVAQADFPNKKGGLTKISAISEPKLSFMENLVDIKEVFVGLEDDQPDLADLAAEFGITDFNARQIKHRLSKLAKELFGYGIEASPIG